MHSSIRSFKFLLIFVLFAIISFGNFPRVSAQSACTDNTNGKSRAQLEQELEACNREIEEWTNILNKTRNDSASFARDVSALTAKINAAQANIKSKNIAISNLSKDIASKEARITELDSRIVRGQKSLAQILRKTNEIDSYSLAEALLSGKDFSAFFVDIDNYSATEDALARLFSELRGHKELTEQEKIALNKKKQAEAEARAEIERTKKEVEMSQQEKKELLAVSKDKEKTYGQVLADRQAKAAQIRAVLFPLRDAGAIPFGTALQYADAASAKTGVRSALILGILQQESNLGANVGTCVIVDLQSGETKSVNSGKVFKNGIHPSRDLPLLQTILPALGRDPLNTKVSCPLSIGYGGAMGPAQFIPSTWNIMMDRVAQALGKELADPWNPQDAIMASAMFLADLGASSQSASAERSAACRYYGGGSGCTSRTSSYGNQVMSRASTIQSTMIDPLRNL